MVDKAGSNANGRLAFWITCHLILIDSLFARVGVQTWLKTLIVRSRTEPARLSPTCHCYIIESLLLEGYQQEWPSSLQQL